MQTESLVRMANQIGAFFDSMPDREEAQQGVAQHLKKFWAPRMRQALLSHIDSDGTAELNAMVVESISRHRAMLE